MPVGKAARPLAVGRRANVPAAFGKAQALNDFANAVRECLGLEPLVRHNDTRAPPNDDARRFYRDPYVWDDVTGDGQVYRRHVSH